MEDALNLYLLKMGKTKSQTIFVYLGFQYNTQIMNYLNIFFTMLLLAACTQTDRKESTSEIETVSLEEWKEAKEEFHMVLGLTYHPAKDVNDLVPIKEDYLKLDSVADYWAAKGIPAELDSTYAKEMLAKLITATESFKQTVESDVDSVIMEEFIIIHDYYHKLAEL